MNYDMLRTRALRWPNVTWGGLRSHQRVAVVVAAPVAVPVAAACYLIVGGAVAAFWAYVWTVGMVVHCLTGPVLFCCGAVKAVAKSTGTMILVGREIALRAFPRRRSPERAPQTA